MKIFIADPQPKVRRALSIWVSKQPGWEVAGESAEALDLCRRLGQFTPGVLILDRGLPGLPPADLIARLRQAARGIIIILLTTGPLERRQARALNADFYVSKVDPPDCIYQALTQAEHLLEDK